MCGFCKKLFEEPKYGYFEDIIKSLTEAEKKKISSTFMIRCFN